MSNQKSYSVTEIEMNSNSHPATNSYSDKGKEQLKTSRLESIRNQAVSQTFVVISSTLFCFRPRSESPRSYSHLKIVPKTQEELLSTAPPRSADDPEISIFPSKCSKLPSTQIPPAVWRQNLVSRLQLKLRWSEHIGKITPHNGPHYGLKVSRWGHNYIPCAWTYWMPKPIIAKKN